MGKTLVLVLIFLAAGAYSVLAVKDKIQTLVAWRLAPTTFRERNPVQRLMMRLFGRGDRYVLANVALVYATLFGGAALHAIAGPALTLAYFAAWAAAFALVVSKNAALLRALGYQGAPPAEEEKKAGPIEESGKW